MATTTISKSDREVLVALFRNGSRIGDSLKELSEVTGFSTQRIATVAKRYDGRRFKWGVVSYFPPQNDSMSKHLPGIRNPNSGIGARIPAMVSVKRNGKPG